MSINLDRYYEAMVLNTSWEDISGWVHCGPLMFVNSRDTELTKSRKINIDCIFEHRISKVDTFQLNHRKILRMLTFAAN